MIAFATDSPSSVHVQLVQNSTNAVATIAHAIKTAATRQFDGGGGLFRSSSYSCVLFILFSGEHFACIQCALPHFWQRVCPV